MTSELRQAIAAINSGDKITGKKLLRQILAADRSNENAWLWMAKVVDSPQEKMQCLRNLITINPNNDLARRELAQLQAYNSSPQSSLPTQPPAPRRVEPPPLPFSVDSPPGTQKPRPKHLRSLSKSSDQVEVQPTTRQCPYCAETIKAQARVCRYCGRDLATGIVAGQHQSVQAPPQQVIVQMPPQRQWSPGVAAVLSFLFPGVGQLYKGQVGRGLLVFFMTVIGYALFVIPGLIIHLIAIVDAAQGNPYGNSGQSGNLYHSNSQSGTPYGNSGQSGTPYGNSGQSGNSYGNSSQSGNSYSNSGQSRSSGGSGAMVMVVVLVLVILGLCVLCPMLGGIMGAGV